MPLSTDYTWHATPGDPDGAVLGRTSTEKIAFFGATPVVRNATPFSTGTGTVAQLAAILAAYGLITTSA